jgi:hypothetical protein
MTALHHSTIRFFESKMSVHNRVMRWTRLPDNSYVLYRIERTNDLDNCNVFLSDAYNFGYADYIGRPEIIGIGDYVIVARPESSFDMGLIQEARYDQIGLGRIGAFMGALNSSRIWEYVSPDERRWRDLE